MAEEGEGGHGRPSAGPLGGTDGGLGDHVDDRSVGLRGIELTPEHPVDRLVELGVAAERAGFDTLFSSCHYNNRDPFQALSSIAERTDTIRLGPGVANPYETHPVALASRVATLAEASGGRAVFGLGAGDVSTLSNLGVERDRPLRRVLETMQVARRLFAGGRVDHDGTFQATDAGLNYESGPVPVYVGAQGPDMLRMAGKHADGVLVNASHPDDLAWATDRVAEGEKARSPRHEPVEVVAYASVSVAQDPQAAREAARPPVAFITAGAAEPALARHRIDPDRASAIRSAIEAGEFSRAFEQVTDPMLDAFCVAGDVDAVAERLAAIGRHVDGLVVGSPLGPDPEAAISLAATALDRLTPE